MTSCEKNARICFIGQAQQEVHLCRIEIKIDLNPEYRQLCTSQVTATKLLFADDLAKSIRDCMVNKYRGGGGAIGNVADKKHMTHPLLLVQNYLTHPVRFFCNIISYTTFVYEVAVVLICEKPKGLGGLGLTCLASRRVFKGSALVNEFFSLAACIACIWNCYSIFEAHNISKRQFRFV